MATITLRGVTKSFGGGDPVLKSCDLDIADHEFLVLVGPSGSGKTTLLRIISGLEDATDGDLMFGDRMVNNVPPGDRDIAMVFQNYGLYPHMTVFNNMAFGLKRRRLPREVIGQKVAQAARTLGIEELLGRKPKQLSGGQRQRVALGRAIVRDPAVFLLDEPLSNLDAHLRTQMRSEILEVHRTVTATAVYVTHDQVEALTMGDRIAVMNDGVIQQVDTPETLYDRPVNRFVAGFIGTPPMGFLPGVLRRDDGVVVESPGVRIRLSEQTARCLPADIDDVVVGVRPEHVRLVTESAADDEPATVRGVVDLVEPLGSEQHASVDVAGSRLVARLSRKDRVAFGDKVTLAVDHESVHLFHAETGVAFREPV